MAMRYKKSSGQGGKERLHFLFHQTVVGEGAANFLP
jgi:hypothetical protein